MSDLMFKAADKAAWDAFISAQSNETRASILIDEIGPIMVTPPVIVDGEIVTPAVMDDAHHVNVRVLSDTVDCVELAKGGPGVDWIDPATVNSPSRIWAGGMNYWIPEV